MPSPNSPPSERSGANLRSGLRTAIGPWAKVALVGLVMSAVLAVALAWFIPRKAEEQFLMAMARSDEDLVSVLVTTVAIDPQDLDIAALDAQVDQLIGRGRLVRAKLWSVDSRIIYSDEKRLIGRNFEADEDFAALTETEWHVSDLHLPENVYERELGYDRLLETYVPVQLDGKPVAVWEVYRPLEGFDAAVASVRLNVWLAVGVGLGTLALFLVTGFGALILAADRRRLDAELRSRELADLLGLARVSAASIDPAAIARESVAQIASRDAVRCVCLLEYDDTRSATILSQAGADPLCGLEALERSERPNGEARKGSTSHMVRLDNLGLWVCQPTGSDPIALPVFEAMLGEISLGIQRARAYQEIEANRAHIEWIMERLLQAQEDERRATVAEIHDGLAQDLYRVLFGIRGCLTASEEDARAELTSLEALVAESSRQLRRLLQEIHPSVVDDVGLEASLRSLGERMATQHDLAVDLEFSPFIEPEYDTRVALFRIIQEALTNAAKHSGSERAVVSVGQRRGYLKAIVGDSGHGLSDFPTDGIGLWIMRERAETLGGTVEIESDATGTNVLITIPIGATSEH